MPDGVYSEGLLKGNIMLQVLIFCANMCEVREFFGGGCNNWEGEDSWDGWREGVMRAGSQGVDGTWSW